MKLVCGLLPLKYGAALGTAILAHLVASWGVVIRVCARCSGPWQWDWGSPTLRLPLRLWVRWPTDLQKGNPQLNFQSAQGCPGACGGTAGLHSRGLHSKGFEMPLVHEHTVTHHRCLVAGLFTVLAVPDERDPRHPHFQ